MPRMLRILSYGSPDLTYRRNTFSYKVIFYCVMWWLLPAIPDSFCPRHPFSLFHFSLSPSWPPLPCPRSSRSQRWTTWGSRPKSTRFICTALFPRVEFLHTHTHTLAHSLHCCLTFWLPLHSPLLGRIFCICCLHFLTPAPFLGYSSLLFAPVITLGAALAKGGNCLPTLLPLLSDIFGSFSSVTSQWWQCMMYSPLGLPRCCPALCLFFSPYFPLHVFSICLKVPCFLYSDANWEFPLWFLAGISHPNRFHS